MLCLQSEIVDETENYEDVERRVPGGCQGRHGHTADHVACHSTCYHPP